MLMVDFLGFFLLELFTKIIIALTSTILYEFKVKVKIRVVVFVGNKVRLNLNVEFTTHM
jgi:hypothetical protein